MFEFLYLILKKYFINNNSYKKKFKKKNEGLKNEGLFPSEFPNHNNSPPLNK